MAPYDSDSSGGEEEDFTETNVLLGYASPDANGEEISRLGGHPDWLDTGKAPSAALARCKVCKDLMVLILQLNAELPERFPTHDRRLYVLACKRKSCRRKEGSIRAIRGVRVSAEAPTATPEKNTQPEEKVTAKPPSQGLGDALFGAKPATASGTPRVNPFATPSTQPTNPFAPKPASATPTNPLAKPQPATTTAPEPSKPDLDTTTTDLPKTFAQTLSLNNPQATQGPPPPPEPWPEVSAQPAPYPIRWLSDAEYETLDPITLPTVPQATTVMDIDSTDGSGSGGGKEDKEVFESSMDATFQKFADRVGQNPEQCIRYEFAGQPLLYAKGDAVGKLLHVSEKEKVATSKGLPRCGSCGAGRVFEVQLTPQAIQELECEEDGLDGMDWGTVIVGVCERDCQERGVGVGEAGYLEEWVGVQWEELTMKR
ncbi:programmed cell death protein 2 [Chaetomium tenue]|uniref:Programmed cell death protein 2 n=1 Tax=Chaetomium tenue TaxID=1854479 RepID=A0ACB7NYU0_9PEZI|nr:programmed cell death protein 2 [Chaetomium globosum]